MNLVLFIGVRFLQELKEDVPFEGHIARRYGYYIFRDVSRAVMITISGVVSCAARDAWKNMSSMGPGQRDIGCVSLGQTCIIILDIAFHCFEHAYHN